MTDHAFLSPSAAGRWMTCPGSAQLEAEYPDETSVFAAEGTAFHAVVSDCLELGMEPHDFVGHTREADGYEFEITDEMADHAVFGLDLIREMRGDLHIEHRVDLGAWLPGQFGTLDVGIVRDDLIVIFDWKYGRGVPVYPQRNFQLMLYALGFWDNVARHKTDTQNFRLIIEQPRIFGAGGSWDCTLKELLQFGEHAVEQAEAAFRKDAPLHASDKACQFCKARPDCPEFHRFNLELLDMAFDDLDTEDAPNLLDVGEMTPERRAYVARHASMFRKWMDDLHGRVLNDAVTGAAPTPGLKAVEGRAGPRKWSDEKKAEGLMVRSVGKRKAFEQKLLSPTQAEKVLSTSAWGRAQKYIERADPKPSLVNENDRREALKPATDLFDDVSADSDIEELI